MRAFLIEEGNTIDDVRVESACTYGGWTTIWLANGEEIEVDQNDDIENVEV